MRPEVSSTGDPAAVLATAGTFLGSDPVRHNVVVTLLSNRISHPEPGRYWITLIDGEAAGVVLQSPLQFVATLTPMPDEAVAAVVDAIVGGGVALPGVTGEAAVAARFAGQWTERTRSAAWPVQGQRVYEVDTVVAPQPAPGRLRPATAGDRQLLVGWFGGYRNDTGGGTGDVEEVVGRRLADGELWLWDHDGPATMVGLSQPQAGVVRLAPVYTPIDRRGRGYASSCVAAASGRVLAAGLRCILYTDLANPTSNAIYRSLGYRAVSEGLRYRFA